MARRRAAGGRRGFTRTDLVAAVLVLLVAGGLLLADNQRVRDASNRAQSANNLKQMTIALLNCNDTYGKIPSAVASFFPVHNPNPNVVFGGMYGPCQFILLPFIEQDLLFKSTSLMADGLPINAAWKAAGKTVKTYVAPGDPTAGADPTDHTSYVANGLALPVGHARIPATFADGTSNTIVFAEAYAHAGGILSEGGQTQTWLVDRRWWDDPFWTPSLTSVPFQLAPATNGAYATLPQGFTPTGIYVGMADCTVHRVSAGCGAQTFYHACTPNGGEVLGADW